MGWMLLTKIQLFYQIYQIIHHLINNLDKLKHYKKLLIIKVILIVYK